MDKTVFEELARSLQEVTKAAEGLKGAMSELSKLLPKRKVIIKGADIKPDVYGGYLQKKRRKRP